MAAAHGLLDGVLLGWQLGEHGEWCKHTNFDLATNAPMFFVVPGVTDQGVVSNTPTEYVKRGNVWWVGAGADRAGT